MEEIIEKDVYNVQSSYYINGMKLITTPQAQDILKIEGRSINWRTFMRLTKKFNVKPDLILPQGTKLWDIEKVFALARHLPTKRVYGPKGLF